MPLKRSKTAGAKRGGGRGRSSPSTTTSSSKGGRGRAHARSDVSDRSQSKRPHNSKFRETIRRPEEERAAQAGPRGNYRGKGPQSRGAERDDPRDFDPSQEGAERRQGDRRGGNDRRSAPGSGYGSTASGAHAFQPGKGAPGRNQKFPRFEAPTPQNAPRPFFKRQEDARTRPIERDEDEVGVPRPPRPAEGSTQVMEGRIDLHPDGFGFLIAKDPKLPNVYVGAESLKHVMHRDTVRVRVEKSFDGGAKLRGSVIEILGRHQKEFMGVVRPYKGGVLVIPTEARDRKHSFKAETTTNPQLEEIKSGTPVLCRILTYPSNMPGTVEIVQAIEDPSAPHNDTLRVLIEASWPREFSRAALDEAEKRAASWKQEIDPRRRDITHLPLVTIDGRDARDFDDAVCAVREGQSTRLWVAIADVSHFVRPGSTLDREAFAKSTSAYFPDHVVPMLPEILSNGVCSLNPFEERACLVCEMLIGPRGQLESYEFYEGLMLSKRRLTYEQMQAFIEDEPWARNELATLQESLGELIAVYRRLREARTQRGSIDLDLPEAQVILSREGEVLDIQTRTRLDAHRLIEECMLVANEAAAAFLYRAGNGAVYRIHEAPDPRRVEDLKKFLRLAGIMEEKSSRPTREKLKAGDTDESFTEPWQFAELLARLKRDFEPGDPIARAAQTLVLRTMKQARYSTARVGHFALASKDYTHYTSPIRRYPDLMVHRLIKENLGFEPYLRGGVELEANCSHCSDQERLAMDAERKLIEIKKCRFMEAFLGETFEGWVTGVIEKGVFCQIDGHFVDGLVNEQTLHDRGRFHFEPERMAYIGPGKAKITLGSRVKVMLAAVDVMTRKIDFDLLEVDGVSVGKK
mgnify:CR=1 FL=1